MALSASAAMWFLPFALPICIWAAWSDLARMKIPNKSVLALMVVFVVVGLVAVPLAEYPWRLLQLVIVMLVGFLLNMIGAIGAGDAKFAAAMAPFVPQADLRIFLVLFAAVLLAAFLTHRLFRAVPVLRGGVAHWESWETREFPMGLALGSALIFYLALGIAFGA